eukprot:TRINITY_DN3229_c0_g2_i1.p1 TRINITY_DN3229_c0_g2~~TRINITY_DN3229_c0_g2_i1.p1  ORF type:complete len:66 (-),score=1.65 TRINITY_DN3229_c0_g2_i1:190-387(-)
MQLRYVCGYHIFAEAALLVSHINGPRMMSSTSSRLITAGCVLLCSDKLPDIPPYETAVVNFGVGI